jgi:hypothetical protein
MFAIKDWVCLCSDLVVVAVEVAGQVLELQAVWFVALEADAADPGQLEAIVEAELVWIAQAVPGLAFAEWDVQGASDQVVELWAVWFADLEEGEVGLGLLEAVAEAELVWFVRAAPGLVFAVQEQDVRVAFDPVLESWVV